MKMKNTSPLFSGSKDASGESREADNSTLPEKDCKHVCPICRLSFSSTLLFSSHSLSHVVPCDEFRNGVNTLRLRPVTAVSGLMRDYELRSEEPVADVGVWLRMQSNILNECLSPLMRQFAVRSMFYTKIKFFRIDPQNGNVVDRMSCYIPSASSSLIVDFNECYESHIQSFICTFNKIEDSSAWQYEDVDFVIFKFSLSLNYGGRGTFKLPETLKKLQAVVNVDCDTQCFKYAVLSMLHYNDLSRHRHRSRVSEYSRWENDLKFDDVNVDEIKISTDIPKVEKMNNLKINVHVWDKGLKGCRYNSRKSLASKTVNLLLVVNSEGESHYCGIASLSRLYRHLKNTHNRHHMCERCIRSFKNKEDLKIHFEWCVRGKAQIEEMPKEKEYNYKSFGHELSPIRVIYADAECFIDPETRAHHPAAVACYEVWHPHINKTSEVLSWVGEGCVEKFLTKLEYMVKDQFENDNITRKQIIMSPAEYFSFNRATNCAKCHRPFTEKLYKVRDHCHITGEYRGALCSICNTRLRLKRNALPVIFHNLKNYDAHLIIKNGIGKMKGWEMSVIAQTREKFMSITARIPVGVSKKGKTIFNVLQFIDSYQFMNSSLSSLSQNLTSLPHTQSLRSRFPTLTKELIMRKGIFPYSYFDSLARLDETTLPHREHFKNDLTNEECSEEDYSHAQLAWEQFGCSSFGEYMLCYLQLDVLLLADVFEAFRKLSLDQDGLEPVHFVSLPSLSFMSAFKMTNETIHLIQNPFVYNMFERGIRGGLTFVNVHHMKSGTVVDEANGKECNKILLYIDQNNLYGEALSKPLPHSNFTLLSPEDIALTFPNEESILALDDEAPEGFVFELDLNYPSNVHDKTRDFPLAPESLEVTDEMLSPYMRSYHSQLMDQRHHASKTFKSCRKLLMTTYDKRHYVVHFSILKFYLSMGLKVDKIHHVIKFSQKAFLKPYISFNSEQRAKAKNSFEKDFYKLKNNSLFGKTMEDVRKRMNYKVSSNEERILKLIASPLFLDRDIISEDVVGIKMVKPKVVLDKPIYVGQAVLDYSKLSMYRLFYETLPHCPLINKVQLLGGDTDSFFLALTVDEGITADDVLRNLESYVDFSNYPSDHPLFSNKNKAKLGCFKDECSGKAIEEIILLRPKMYSIKLKDSDDNINRAKGISKCIVRNLRHETYQEVYEEAKETSVEMTILKSIQHTVHTVTFRKRALSCFDDKRCWLTHNESLPHGHVDSPVPPPKRRRIMLPARGDVNFDD